MELLWVGPQVSCMVYVWLPWSCVRTEAGGCETEGGVSEGSKGPGPCA